MFEDAGNSVDHVNTEASVGLVTGGGSSLPAACNLNFAGFSGRLILARSREVDILLDGAVQAAGIGPDDQWGPLLIGCNPHVVA